MTYNQFLLSKLSSQKMSLQRLKQVAQKEWRRSSLIPKVAQLRYSIWKNSNYCGFEFEKGWMKMKFGAARYCEIETSWVSGRASLISWRRIWDLANLWNRTGWKRIRLQNWLHNAIVQVFRASPPTSKTKLVLRHAKPNPLFPAPRTAWSCPRWTTGGTGAAKEKFSKG